MVHRNLAAIPEMDFAFGNKNHTDVSQLAPLVVGMSIHPILMKNHFTKVCKVTSFNREPNLAM
ncbi:hypothetical protein [Bacillus cereus]|uniref:Uncharacterized protein n=1 Tax=Bacillus cereus TaxID=1396 RepID=A0A2A7HPV9_BACCE|nr:hypothetical protein [Bacillus cereus]PEC19082.1 hypothetical protein COM96_26950 [Bacillus cereus]